MGCRRSFAVAWACVIMPSSPIVSPVTHNIRASRGCVGRFFVAYTTATFALVSFGAAQRSTVVPVRDTARSTLGSATLTVDHDAMVSADSALIGTVIPLGTWMMGSVTPGRLVTSAALVIDEKEVPAGTYSLWVEVTRQSATLIVNRDPPRTRMSYDSSRDVARVPLSVGRGDSAVRRFSVRIQPAARVVSTVRFTFERPENPRCPKFFQCFDISVEAEKPDAMLLFEWQWIRWTVPLRFVVDSAIRDSKPS